MKVKLSFEKNKNNNAQILKNIFITKNNNFYL